MAGIGPFLGAWVLHHHKGTVLAIVHWENPIPGGFLKLYVTVYGFRRLGMLLKNLLQVSPPFFSGVPINLEKGMDHVVPLDTRSFHIQR